MNSFDTELAQRLASLAQQGLFRELRRIDSAQSPHIVLNGKSVLNFSSNDYLGLANHPALKTAAAEAIGRFGAGAGASRLVCGSLAVYHELEESIASFKALPAALGFSTGYAAALGAICSVLGKEDVIILDKLVHASIVDAARLSGARLRVFAHNDLNVLEDILIKERHRSSKSRILIVTESVFSMDGDCAPLRELVDLKARYGSWLMLDEAHATGLYGPNRRGLAEECGVSERIEIQMGTLGKALGAAGGYLCGSRTFIDYLVNRARSFIFSTAPVPAAAAAATAGVRLVASPAGEEYRQRLWQRVDALSQTASSFRSAIIPISIGDETRALEAAARLRAQGIFVPAIRYPTVARGKARLRVTLTAAHTSQDVQQLKSALALLEPAASHPPEAS